MEKTMHFFTAAIVFFNVSKSPAGSANEQPVAAGSCKIARSHELWYHGYNIKGGLVLE